MVGICTAITMTMEMQGLLLGAWLTIQGGIAAMLDDVGPEMSIVTIYDSMCIVHGGQASSIR